MPLDPGHLIGVYEIVGPLGAGGMGEVYRARDTRLGRLVAIKFVSSDLAADASAAERLAHEARIASSLNHPNIVTVHDVGEVDGRPYIVMEFVDGESLHDRLSRGALDLRTAVDLSCQVADGLAAAHGAAVVHRDLKPRNIMVTTSDRRAKIVDFGLGKTSPKAAGSDEATMRASGITDEYVIVGTAGYMAPEQCTRRPVDFRADQFALGAVIYEMLTGRRAFKRDTAFQTMSAIVEAEPEPLGEVCPTAPLELITVVQRCLAKDPANRYASTQDLARDLHDVKSALSMGSWPSPRPRPASVAASDPTPLPVPRPKRWIAAAAVGVVLLGIVAAAAWVLRPDPLAEGLAFLVRHDRRADLEQAVKWLERAAAEGGDNPAALVALAEALVRQADTRMTPDATQQKALLARAAALCGTAQNLSQDDAAAHVVLAMINYAQRQFAGAVDQAEQAIEQSPGNARAWQEKGLAKLRLQQFSDAEEALKRGVALAPADWWAHHLLGNFYLTVERPQEALSEIQEAYSRAPDNSRVLNNLGTAFLKLEQFDKAKGSYEQSMVVEPNFVASSNLGTVLYEQQEYEQAILRFEEAVKFADAKLPREYRLWRNLASACQRIPRFAARVREAHEQAVSLGEAELKMTGGDLVKTALADSYAALGRRKEARQLVAELEQRPPTEKDALFTLATLHEQHFRDRARALVWLDRAKRAGYSMARIERSPLLADLRNDERFSRMMRQQ